MKFIQIIHSIKPTNFLHSLDEYFANYNTEAFILNRVLYYTDWGSAGHVGRVGLDGSNKVMLTTAENPNDLIISDNKLLIINNKQPTAEIIEIDLANSNGVTNSRQLSNVVSQAFANITKQKRVLYRNSIISI